jgi:hypothetical protein
MADNPSLRDDLLKQAANCGWQQQDDTESEFYNVVLSRTVDHGRREWLDLRFKNGKLTAVRHRHPRRTAPRRITLRKVDHVHAILRARATWPVS